MYCQRTYLYLIYRSYFKKTIKGAGFLLTETQNYYSTGSLMDDIYTLPLIAGKANTVVVHYYYTKKDFGTQIL